VSLRQRRRHRSGFVLGPFATQAEAFGETDPEPSPTAWRAAMC